MRSLRARLPALAGSLALTAKVAATPRSAHARKVGDAGGARAPAGGARRHARGRRPRPAGGTERRSSPAARLMVGVFSIVNRYRPWHRLPLPLALANLDALRIQLRERNLYDTSTPDQLTLEPLPLPTPRVLYTRTEDGSYNDLNDPMMGRAGV